MAIEVMTANTDIRETGDLLKRAWDQGYSIAELWGASKPASRGGQVDGAHLIMWGILSIVEYQVDRGAGHKYLRDRLWFGDWTAIGVLAPKVASSTLVRLPPIKDAKFGRRSSAVGDGMVNYVDVRILQARLFDELATGGAPESGKPFG